MKVLIHVCAIDEERGVKSTKEEVVEVPKGVLALHEMFAGNDADKLLSAISIAVFSGAMKELQASRRNPSAALAEQVDRGAKVGGSTPEATDPMAEALGLDIIRKDVRGGQQPPRQQQPQQPQRPMGPPPTSFGGSAPPVVNPGPGPGPVGFPRGR